MGEIVCLGIRGSMRRLGGSFVCYTQSVIEPEVAGGLGDDILATHPCFIVSKTLSEAIRNSSLCGYQLDIMNISYSDEFKELQRDCKVPDFVRMIPTNSIDDAKLFNSLGMDFYVYKKRYLVISEKALLIIKQFHIANTTICMVAF